MFCRLTCITFHTMQFIMLPVTSAYVEQHVPQEQQMITDLLTWFLFRCTWWRCTSCFWWARVCVCVRHIYIYKHGQTPERKLCYMQVPHSLTQNMNLLGLAFFCYKQHQNLTPEPYACDESRMIPFRTGVPHCPVKKWIICRHSHSHYIWLIFHSAALLEKVERPVW